MKKKNNSFVNNYKKLPKAKYAEGDIVKCYMLGSDNYEISDYIFHNGFMWMYGIKNSEAKVGEIYLNKIV